MMNFFEKFLDVVPRVEYFPEYDPTGTHNGISCAGIKVLAYDGADYDDQHTKVFAHVGFPDDRKGPVPAIVLIHGGGGHPEDIWIKKWNQRGYAAISMDTTGYFPTKPTPYLYEGFADGLARELTAPFAEENYTVSPDNSRMDDTKLTIEKQWMYHAVSQVILAHNILRSDERIDSSKIGVAGISWGSVIASIAIGYDTRFAFAVPIYGSGHLGCGSGFCCPLFRKPGVLPWLAEKQFHKVKIPVMWLCWNDDAAFSINSNSMSYYDTKDNNPNTCLSIKHQMNHSHHHGYMPMESYWFADRIVKGEQVPAITAEYNDREFRFSCSQKAKSVRFFYLTKIETDEKENGGKDTKWQIVDLDPADNFVMIPEEAIGSYVEFTLEDGIILTTPYNE